MGMVKLKIIIADNDKGYLNAVSKYLASWDETDFNVISFNDKDLLEDYLKINKVDILLISPSLMNEDINLKNVQVTIMNTPDRIPENMLKYPFIDKYQSGDSIARELLSIFSKNSKDEIIIKKNSVSCEVIGVYSPVGGIGKTTVSLGIAKSYATSRISTLFISLEEMASYKGILDCNNNNNFSDLLYYIKQKNKNLMMKIEGLKNVDVDTGLNYFSPLACYRDIYEISEDELVRLIEFIKCNSNYERVILDFDSNLSDKNIELMKTCDKVLLLTNIDRISITKLQGLYDNLKKLGIEDLNSNVKMIFNNNIMQKQILQGVTIINKKIDLYVPYDNKLYIYEDNKNHMNLEGCFGRTLKGYVNKEIKGEVI
ncbi:chromosome partitioning protein ParA [Vallitalea longa]|uniref:Chromosome partitioning protein ParA n=1 Tax=Vallitalea longa TaxID=2936439 RepID=A0A9W5YCM7_9FIRM|nr:AAA family ATPase [Vallitalea longa]GKX30629.1 chromosome partitioning protein ParA [Vallitalea longa]